MKVSRLEFISLALLCIFGFVLSALLLNHGHDWGDDFASYIMQARSIVEGTIPDFLRRSQFLNETCPKFGAPNAYRWGYPTLLAPLYAWFGLNLMALKIPNVLAFQCFLVCSYLLMRRKLSILNSFLVTAFLATNPQLLGFQNQIISDLVFLTLSTLTLLIIDRIYFAGTVAPYRYHALIGICIGVAYFTRHNAILLLGSLFLSQVVSRFKSESKNRVMISNLAFAVPYMAFLVCALLIRTVFPVIDEPVYAMLFHPTWKSISSNFFSNFEFLGFLFSSFYLPNVLSILVLIFFFIGFTAHFREIHLVSYFLFTFGLFVVWPPTQGLRHVLPLVPIYCYFSFLGMMTALDWIPEKQKPIGRLVFYVTVTMVLLVALRNDYRLVTYNFAAERTMEGPFDQESKSMFDFISTQTEPKAVIAFYKPRAMRLLTGRDCLYITDCAQLRLVDFTVVQKSESKSGEITAAELPACGGVTIKPVFDNNNFQIFQILKH